MKKPLFQVGEEVILQSKFRPDLNGTCTVKQIVYLGDEYTCRTSGRIVVNNTRPGTFGYILEEVKIHTTSDEGHFIENLWNESALRKKHKPSELSFQELVSSLNTSIKA